MPLQIPLKLLGMFTFRSVFGRLRHPVCSVRLLGNSYAIPSSPATVFEDVSPDRNPARKGDHGPIVHQFLQKLKPEILKQIKSLDSPFKPDEVTKNEIVNGLNRLLHNKHTQRSEVEAAFPGISSAKRTAFFFAIGLSGLPYSAALIGARLGQVFFYDWEDVQPASRRDNKSLEGRLG